MLEAPELKLVTVIVQHRDEKKVLDAALAAGAPGATYFYGRGTGVRQRLGLLGWLVEAEKVIVLMAVPPDKLDAVVKAVSSAAQLDKPGNGLLCVHTVHQVIGLA